MSKPSSATVSFPIRMDAALDAKISEAVQLSGMKKAELIRAAIAAGIEDMRRENFDIGRLISNSAKFAADGAKKAEE